MTYTLTPEQREREYERVRRTRAEQGLPPHIVDPTTLHQVAQGYREYLRQKEAA